MEYKIESNILEVENALIKAHVGVKDMAKKVLSTLSRGVKSAIQGNIYTKLKRRTGKSKQNVYAVNKRDFSYVIMRPFAKYFVLEHGGKILPKKKKYLTFKVGGKWVKVKEVNIQPHNFFHPASKRYFDGKANADLEKLIEKQIMATWK